MSQRVIRWILLSLALLTSGCGGLRAWLAPFRGLNSDVQYGEPGVGQYRPPGDQDAQPDIR